MLTLGVWTIACISLIAHWEKVRAFALACMHSIKALAIVGGTLALGVGVLCVLLFFGYLAFSPWKRAWDEAVQAGPTAGIVGLVVAIFMAAAVTGFTGFFRIRNTNERPR